MRRKQLPNFLGMGVEFGSELPGSLCKKGNLISYGALLISKGRCLPGPRGEMQLVFSLVFFFLSGTKS